jgi:hypothetical protein
MSLPGFDLPHARRNRSPCAKASLILARAAAARRDGGSSSDGIGSGGSPLKPLIDAATAGGAAATITHPADIAVCPQSFTHPIDVHTACNGRYAGLGRQLQQVGVEASAGAGGVFERRFGGGPGAKVPPGLRAHAQQPPRLPPKRSLSALHP